METKGGRRELGQIEGLGVDTYTPLTLRIKGLTNENLLYSTGNSSSLPPDTKSNR